MNEQYLEIQNRFEAAYAAFSATYRLQVTEPQRKIAATSNIDKYLMYGFIGTLIGAIVVSASHTIPVFVGAGSGIVEIVVALSAFMMLECGIVTYAFFQIRRSNVNHEIEKVKSLSRRGLLFIMLIALAVNVKSVLSPGDISASVDGQITVWQVAQAIIFIAIAFSAPIIAYISGEILAVTFMYSASAQSRFDQEYAQLMQEYSDGMLSVWKRQQANWGIKIKVEAPAPNSLPDLSFPVRPQLADTDGQHGHGQGYSRSTNSRDKVRTYLADNPSAANMTVRDLAEVIGVGKTVVAEEMRTWKQNAGTDADVV